MARQRYDLERPDGAWEERYWDAVNTPVHGPDGAVRYVLHQTEDVTERVRAEAEVTASEERLRLAVAATGLGVFDWDLTTDRVAVNARFRELLGLPEGDEVIGAAMLGGVVHPDDRAFVEATLAAAFEPRSSGSYRFEHRAVTPAGEVWLLTFGQVFFAGEGEGRRAVRVIGNDLDVTERKLAEAAREHAHQQLQEQAAALEMQAEELQATAAQLEERTEEAERAQQVAETERARATGLLESTADAYFALDAEFRIVAVNAAMERSTGLSRDALLGRVFWEMFPATVGTAYERHYRAAAAEGTTAHFTDAYDDGRLTLVSEADVYPVAGGGVAVFWRDVTARVQAEAALRESEQRFRLMADAVPQIVWITDPDGRVEFFNQQWADYTGVPYGTPV
jgi:PAS domain S-box-containing protein